MKVLGEAIIKIFAIQKTFWYVGQLLAEIAEHISLMKYIQIIQLSYHNLFMTERTVISILFNVCISFSRVLLNLC